MVSALKELGCDARFIRCELGNADDCARLIEQAAAFVGDAGVHGLVNAAAITDRSTLQDMTPEFWDRMMNVNVRAPAILMQKVRFDG